MVVFALNPAYDVNLLLQTYVSAAGTDLFRFDIDVME